jgi:hypothetical protein
MWAKFGINAIEIVGEFENEVWIIGAASAGHRKLSEGAGTKSHCLIKFPKLDAAVSTPVARSIYSSRQIQLLF